MQGRGTYAGSPQGKVVISDKDYSNLIKEENRKHQYHLAEQYGSQIQSRRFAEKESRVYGI